MANGASCEARRTARRIDLLLAVALALLAVNCRDTEEERLQKRANVTGTHLYVAFKLAMSDYGGHTEAKKVRDSMVQLELGLRQVNEGSANRTLIEAQNLTAAADIALGLWGLKQEGRTEVEKWRRSQLSVFGPELFTTNPDQALATEHAALLLALVAMRLHPSAPVPVPDTALLYEAYLLGEAPIAWAEIDGLARSAQAIVFAGEQFCELAEVSTTRLAQLPLVMPKVSPMMLTGLLTGLGRAAAHAPEGALVLAVAVLAQQLPWAMHMLAFAKTAGCLSDSSLPDAQNRAAVQWERAIVVAEQAGFAAPELGFLRAYLAYQRADFERVQVELNNARESALLTPDERQQLNELIAHFDPNERGAIDEFLDPLFMSQWVVRLVHHRLEAAGFYENLRRIPVIEMLSHVFESVALPSQESATETGNRVWRWLTSKWHERR